MPEVFARPLVKTVAFQATFPSLFSIEGKIGDFQASIMREFPEASLLLKQQFVLVQRVEGSQELADPAQTQPIWQFKSPKKVTVSVSRDSLSITSESHKTYSQDNHDKFREVVDLVQRSFFALIRIPLIHRIGLRYINECPLSLKTNDHYRRYFNGALPLDRFPLQEADVSEVIIVAVRRESKLRYHEKVDTTDKGHRLILDMDTWAEQTDTANIMQTTDTLHRVIEREFATFAKADLLAYMRDTNVASP